jgi:hypothetical protein
MRLTIVSILVFSALAPAAGAATGDLKQKQGSAGCVQDAGVAPCAAGHEINSNGVTAAVTSPDGHSLYTSFGFPDQDIAVFDRAADGSIAQKPGTAGCVADTSNAGACVDGNQILGIAGLAVSPDGLSLYGVGVDTGSPLVAFSRDPATGAITQKAGTQGCFRAGGGAGCGSSVGTPRPSRVLVSPDDRFVFVSSNGSAGSNGIAVFQRNTTTHDLTQTAAATACIRPLAASGCTASNAAPDLDQGINDLVITPDGTQLYAAFDSAIQRFDINQTTGALTEVAGSSGCMSSSGSAGACATNSKLTSLLDIAMSSDGKQIYGVTSSNVVSVDRNPATGVLSPRAGAQGCASAVNPGCTVMPVGANFSSVTTSKDGLGVYVTSSPADRVVGLDRDAAGNLTAKPAPSGCNELAGLSCLAVAAFDSPAKVAVSDDGKNVYSYAAGSKAVVAFDRELPAVPPPPLVPTADKTAPVITIKAAGRQKLKKLALEVTVNEQSKVGVTGSVAVARKRKAKHSSPAKSKTIKPSALSRTLAADVKTKLVPKLSKRNAKSLARKIKRGQRVTLTFTVKATDTAGNGSLKKLKIKLIR